MPNPLLYIQTVLFQAIQFSISTLFSSIWPIHRTLSGATTPGQSGPGCDGKERVYHFLQISSITGASPSRTLVWGVLPLLQRCSRCILQPQPTALRSFNIISRTRAVTILPLCSDAVGVFCCPSRQYHSSWKSYLFCRDEVGIFYSPSRLRWEVVMSYLGHSLWESYPSAVMQLVYSAALAYWVIRWRSLTLSAKMQSLYSTVPADCTETF